MKHAPCRLCGRAGKLIKAHVIPEGFFHPSCDQKNTLRLLTNTHGEYPKRAPIGVYDDTIICEECERLFGPWDQYALELLLKSSKTWRCLFHENKRFLYEAYEYNYASLKLFFISLAWRASASCKPFFEGVRLGSFEDTAKTMIEQSNPGMEDDFSVLIEKFDDPFVPVLLDPHVETVCDVKHCRFYLGGYIAHVKVDEKTLPEPLHDFVLSQTPPLCMISRDLLESKELPLMKQIALTNKSFFRRKN